MLNLVYSGFTHNYVKEEVAKQLNFKLHVERGVNSFKEVNSEVERVVGLDNQVPLNLEDWTSVGDFMVIPLYDFDVVLG